MEMTSKSFIFLVVLIAHLVLVIQCQFPTICMKNATLPMAFCCPISAGFSEVCGGPSRGSCEMIKVENQSSTQRWANLPIPVRQDDRLHWPLRFFSFACQCKGNYAGAGCERCNFGFTGENCTTRRPKRVRRDILSMTAEEQRLFRDILNASKYSPSDWSAISVAGPETSDPITLEKLHYINVSVYDFFVHFHYYSARSSMLTDGMVTCSVTLHTLNFAHRGPVFLPWHRYYLLLFEDMLAEIAQKQFHQDDFALAYWDWTNQKDCIICNNDNIGDFYHPNITTSTPRTLEDVNRLREATDTSISPQSKFSRWIPLCGSNGSAIDPCFYCNLSEPNKEFFTRRLNEAPGNEEFATQDEMDYVMSLKVYELPPFDMYAPNTSFRNSLEGFAIVGNHRFGLNTHNLGHNFFEGTGHDRTTSPNDPFFYFHHVFIDKVFEMWLHSKTDEETKYPNCTDKLRFGHDLDDFIVPSFPPVQVRSFYSAASYLGYVYDNNFVGTTLYAPVYVPKRSLQAPQQSNSIEDNNLLIFVVVASAFLLAIIALSIYKYRKMVHPNFTQQPNRLPKKWLFKMPFHSRENTAETVPLLVSTE